MHTMRHLNQIRIACAYIHHHSYPNLLIDIQSHHCHSLRNLHNNNLHHNYKYL